jgi:hypothetical protein
MSTKKNTTVYKKNKKTSKYGGKKSRRTTRKIRKIRKTTRTKKGGALNPADKIGTPMKAGQLYNIGRTLRWPVGQEAGIITSIQPMNDSVKVYFQSNDPDPNKNSYQNTTDTVINNDQIVYIE